jgi:uncharacterized membrane protein YphA (DoxX/SURF4 family)
LLTQRVMLGALTTVQFGPIMAHGPLAVALVCLFPMGAVILLVAGLLTPLASAVMFLAMTILIVVQGLEISAIGLDLLVARVEFLLIAGSLVFLGPGAYSMDARLFGRRQISINGSSNG